MKPPWMRHVTEAASAPGQLFILERHYGETHNLLLGFVLCLVGFMVCLSIVISTCCLDISLAFCTRVPLLRQCVYVYFEFTLPVSTSRLRLLPGLTQFPHKASFYLSFDFAFLAVSHLHTSLSLIDYVKRRKLYP